MFCYNCGNPCEESDRYCRFCGAAQNAPPKPRKGSFWVPVLIMVLLCALGIGLFFAVPYGAPPESAPAAASCFTIRDGVLSFDGASYQGGPELVIPETVDGQQVKSLAEGCFENCQNLTSIALPDSLETIGKHAFRGCTALRGIEIPESVTRIGIEAFRGCTALEAICVSDTLEYVGPGAFRDCDNLYYIYFLGAHQEWIELYDEFITPYTGVFCDDGSFYQGKPKS